MEIFKKAFECALAHEKNKTAIRTRRTYKKQISALEKTIAGLQSVIISKDSSIAGMGHTIDELNAHLDTKKSEIEGLEGDLRNVKSALEDKDKMHVKVLQKLHVQSTLFTNTRKQLEQVTKENEDQSNQIWRTLEENFFLNKRILELDLEVQSLESLLSKLKIDLEAAELRSNFLGQSLKHSREGYDIKSREVLDISTREQLLRASVLNLQEELEQWKRNVQPIPIYASPKIVNDSSVFPLHHALPSVYRREGTLSNQHHSTSFSDAHIPHVFASAFNQPSQEQVPASPDSLSPSSVSPCASPSDSLNVSPVVSPPTSPPRASSSITSRPTPSRHPLLTPFTPSILSYLNTNTNAAPSATPPSPPLPSSSSSFSAQAGVPFSHADNNYLDSFSNFSP